MPIAAFCGLPHSESEVYIVKSSAIGRKPTGTNIADAAELGSLDLSDTQELMSYKRTKRNGWPAKE